jgi:RHS repeat-associated protein
VTLFRTGLFNYTGYDIPIDDLFYSYSGNQLTTVDDASNVDSGFQDGNLGSIDYTYDANGNMITDKNKDISTINYNHLNLPTKITFGTGTPITYLYNAIGQKLEKVVIVYNTKTKVTTKTVTNYLGGFQYTTITKTHPTIRYAQIKELIFPTAEGYVKNTSLPSNTYNYVFNYTDHLGNIRLSYQDINSNGIIDTGEILEESNYYPFGMKHEGYNSNNLQPNYKYKFSGREWQDELGLNMIAMDFRQYDPAIGRFNSMDVLSERAYEITPYRFALNNPNLWMDPTGLFETSSSACSIKMKCY